MWSAVQKRKHSGSMSIFPPMKKENTCNVLLGRDDLRELFDVDGDDPLGGVTIRVPEDTDFVRISTDIAPYEVSKKDE